MKTHKHTTTTTIRNKIKAIGLALITLMAMATVSSVHATVVWQTPFNISGNSDVSTNGNFIWAYNLGGATDVTVNSITFDAFTWATDPAAGIGITIGDLTVGPDTTPARQLSKASVGGGTNNPFASLSSEYKTLLGTMAYATAGYTHLTLGGLTINQEYQVQFWVNDSRNVAATRDATVKINGDSILSAPLSLQVNGLSNPNAGNLGQTVIATFTADSATQVFVVEGQKLDGLSRPIYSYINAVSLHAIPEPGAASLLLMSSAIAGLYFGRRKRTR